MSQYFNFRNKMMWNQALVLSVKQSKAGPRLRDSSVLASIPFFESYLRLGPLHVVAAATEFGSAHAKAGALLILGPNCTPRTTKYVAVSNTKHVLTYVCRYEMSALRDIIIGIIREAMPAMSVRLFVLCRVCSNSLYA